MQEMQRTEHNGSDTSIRWNLELCLCVHETQLPEPRWPRRGLGATLHSPNSSSPSKPPCFPSAFGLRVLRCCARRPIEDIARGTTQTTGDLPDGVSSRCVRMDRVGSECECGRGGLSPYTRCNRCDPGAVRGRRRRPRRGRRQGSCGTAESGVREDNEGTTGRGREKRTERAAMRVGLRYCIRASPILLRLVAALVWKLALILKYV